MIVPVIVVILIIAGAVHFTMQQNGEILIHVVKGLMLGVLYEGEKASELYEGFEGEDFIENTFQISLFFIILTFLWNSEVKE